LWCEACLLGDAREHLGADFVGVVEGPGEVRVAFAAELLVGAAFDDVVLDPADAQERLVDAAGF
jgi:hypothetical protein